MIVALGRGQSSSDGGAHVGRDGVDGDVERISGPTRSVLDLARFEIPFTDHDAMWDADQIRVGEFDAGTLVAVVQQRVDAERFELA